MMKKISLITLGILIGLSLSLSVGAHAEVMSMIGKVITGEYDYTVNNEKLEYKAVIIDGTAYVPARLTGDATGYIVEFDETTGLKLTKKITTPPETISKSIDAINKSINSNNAVIKANEDELEQLRTLEQTESTVMDTESLESRIHKLKEDNVKLTDQASKLTKTLEQIKAQQAESNK